MSLTVACFLHHTKQNTTQHTVGFPTARANIYHLREMLCELYK